MTRWWDRCESQLVPGGKISCMMMDVEYFILPQEVMLRVCPVTVVLTVPDPQFALYSSCQTSSSASFEQPDQLAVSASGVILPPSSSSSASYRVLCHAGIFSHVLSCAASNNNNNWRVLVHRSWYPARVVKLGSVPAVADQVHRLVTADRDIRVGWNWNERGSKRSNPMSASVFCVLELLLGQPEREKKAKEELLLRVVLSCEYPVWMKASSEEPKQSLRRGESVTCIASPLAAVSASAFSNLILHGTLTTQLCEDVWLSDVTLVAGAEGGAVVRGDRDSRPVVVGFVCVPVGVCDVGAYVLVASADVVLQWAGFFSSSSSRVPHTITATQKPVQSLKRQEEESSGTTDEVEQSLVLVTHGSTWGSGICVSADGHIVTARHVVEAVRANESARVRASGQWFRAQVVYVSKGPWDIALLKLIPSDNNHKFVALRSNHLAHSLDIQCNAGCQALGFGVFSPAVGAQASVTTGVISKYVPGVAIISDSAVFCGCSGGMLLTQPSLSNSNTAKVLGMITMTLKVNPVAEQSKHSTDEIKEEGRAQVVSKMVWSIPAPVLARFLVPMHAEEEKTKRPGTGLAVCVESFRRLDAEDERVAQFWALDLPDCTRFQTWARKDTPSEDGSMLLSML